MGHRFHAKTHGEPRRGYLFVKLSKADKRRRRKQRKLEESRPSGAELRERYAVRYAGGWPPALHPFQIVPGAAASYAPATARSG